jgi:hypothetical protein
VAASFSMQAMVDGVLGAYRETLEKKVNAGRG